MIKVTKINIPELPTEKPRRLYVYLPRSYNRSGKRYPVVYMFDGHNVFYDSHATYGRSWRMKEYLQRSGDEVIIAAIECNPEGNRRLNEYSPWSFDAGELGFIEWQGRQTMEWIANVLKPMIDSSYRTLPEREHTMIAGSSMGGIMSLWALVEYNEVFSRAAALSPSLWLEPQKMAEAITARKLKKPTRVYLDMGGKEAKGHKRLITTMFEDAKLLADAGAEAAARVVPNAEHNEAAWEKRIPVFMDYLFDRTDR